MSSWGFSISDAKVPKGIAGHGKSIKYVTNLAGKARTFAFPAAVSFFVSGMATKFAVLPSPARQRL